MTADGQFRAVSPPCGIKAGWYAIEADGTQLTFSKVTLPKSMQSNTSELVTSSALTAGGNHRNVSYARF
jgi:hypothetical protein